MFGHRRKRKPNGNMAPVPPWQEVHDLIVATVVDAVRRSERTDVTFTVEPEVEPSPARDFTWWVTLRAGDAEEDVIVSPNGQHFVAENESRYFENSVDGDRLVEFVRGL